MFGRRNLLTNNVAIGNDGTGFYIYGDEHFASRNTAIAQGDGFSVMGTKHTLLGNVSNGNFSGYTVTRVPRHELRHNSALGNSDAGIRVFPGATATLLRRNNIYGNGVRTSSSRRSSTAACSISPERKLDATQNFWVRRAAPAQTQQMASAISQE